jgi:hypothetical protein
MGYGGECVATFENNMDVPALITAIAVSMCSY